MKIFRKFALLICVAAAVEIGLCGMCFAQSGGENAASAGIGTAALRSGEAEKVGAAQASEVGKVSETQGSGAGKNSEEKKSEAEINLEKLFERNPFGTPKNSSAGSKAAEDATKTPQGLELRSICRIGGAWYFGISDSAQKKSYTLKLGAKPDANTPFAAEFFDDETDTVLVSTPIGVYSLTLKERDELTAPPVSTVAVSAKKTTQGNAQVRQKVQPRGR